MKTRTIQGHKIRVGSAIKFRTWDRNGYHTATRRVTELDPNYVGVNFNYCRPWMLMGQPGDKILEVKQY